MTATLAILWMLTVTGVNDDVPIIPGPWIEWREAIEYAVSIALAERELIAANLPPTIVVDCSHGNTNKDPSLQPMVAENCIAQIVDGNRSIVGLMLESHLKAGNQPIPKDLTQLEYGVSITDPCIDWLATETLLLKMHQTLQRVRR